MLLPECNSHLLSPFEIISAGISRLFPVFSTYKYFNVYQRLETAQMKFLRHLLGIIKLDKEKNQWIRGRGAQNIVKEIKFLWNFDIWLIFRKFCIRVGLSFERVNSFVYLGTLITADNNASAEINNRITLANRSYCNGVRRLS